MPGTRQGEFNFERDPKKHYIRYKVWLPWSKRQLDLVRARLANSKGKRRLKYFSFCAIGAIDVLMLDVANVVRQSKEGRFDTIYFFNFTSDDVHETQKRIPGAVGFPGTFTKIVLMDDPNEDTVIDNPNTEQSTLHADDVKATRDRERRLQMRQAFISCHPFDVINLDLEEFLFKPKDPLPGDVIRALQKQLEWQKRPISVKDGREEYIDSFILMFTTQIGPPEMSEDYRSMLRGYIVENLQNDTTLSEKLRRIADTDDINELEHNHPHIFFKLAVQKTLASAIKDSDWYVDPENGIELFEIIRQSLSGSYSVLHMAMSVKRQDPIRSKRAPGIPLQQVEQSYRAVVGQIFERPASIIDRSVVQPVLEELQQNFDGIIARRRLYYPEADEHVILEFQED